MNSIVCDTAHAESRLFKHNGIEGLIVKTQTAGDLNIFDLEIL